jgi:hypothetical protein
MHGGHVSLQSELKKGSRFSVFIPFGFEEYPVKKVIKNRLGGLPWRIKK